jgi:hypothetical protein
MARVRLIAAFAAVHPMWGSTFLALALGLWRLSNRPARDCNAIADEA